MTSLHTLEATIAVMRIVTWWELMRLSRPINSALALFALSPVLLLRSRLHNSLQVFKAICRFAEFVLRLLLLTIISPIIRY